MEYLLWTVVVAAVVVGGIIGYCQYQQRADAKLEAAVDEYNRQIDDDVRQRANVESGRNYNFIEHPKRIDDRQWRDWN
jgi:hypothetical protein